MIAVTKQRDEMWPGRRRGNSYFSVNLRALLTLPVVGMCGSVDDVR